MSRIGACQRVQLGLFGDQRAAEKPVHLVPRRRDLRRDRVTEDGLHRLEQVVADDRVLLRLDSERDVLVGDALHHRGEIGCFRVDQLDGESDH